MKKLLFIFLLAVTFLSCRAQTCTRAEAVTYGSKQRFPSIAEWTKICNSVLFNTSTDILPIVNGGTNTSIAFTSGSVVFSDGTRLTQNNSNFFWNNSDMRLGIGTASPQKALHLSATSTVGLRLTDPGLATGITSYFPTTTAGEISAGSNDDGGITITGLGPTAAGNYPLVLAGYFGNTDPTDNMPGIVFQAAKRSGTSIADLGALETAFGFWTGASASALVTILGSGNMGIGTSTPATKLDVNGTITGDSLLLNNQASVIADDGTIVLPSGVSGWGTVLAFNVGVCDGVLSFRFNLDGTVTQMASGDALNAAVADTDTKLCAFDSGTTVTIKNRLGGTRTLKLSLHYSTN